MIETINLTKRYGDLIALNNLNLTINLMIDTPRQTRGDAAAPESRQLTNGADLDCMQRPDRIGRKPERLHRQRFQCIGLATMWHRAEPCIRPRVRTTTVAGKRHRGTDRRSRRKLRLEASRREGACNAAHEHLLCSVRHPKERRTTGKVAEKAVSRGRKRLHGLFTSIRWPCSSDRDAWYPTLKTGGQSAQHRGPCRLVGSQHKRRTT
jgi:hypothetical protein